jgi:arsenite methyltransferase
MAEKIGYDIKELESVPQSSTLGVGCGAPINFADIKEGEFN